MTNQSKFYPHKKVMIVDDNEIDLYVAKKHIEMASFAEEVVLKESATTALDYLQSQAGNPEELPELIFLDIKMPEMDGFDFLDAYQKLPQTVLDKCNIMMLTSSLDEMDIERAGLNRFVSKFLNKPLDKTKLSTL